MNLAKNSCMASSTGKTALSHSVETDLANSSHIITLLTSTRSGKGLRKTFKGKKVCLCAVCLFVCLFVCLSFFAVFYVFVCFPLHLLTTCSLLGGFFLGGLSFF